MAEKEMNQRTRFYKYGRIRASGVQGCVNQSPYINRSMDLLCCVFLDFPFWVLGLFRENQRYIAVDDV